MFLAVKQQIGRLYPEYTNKVAYKTLGGFSIDS